MYRQDNIKIDTINCFFLNNTIYFLNIIFCVKLFLKHTIYSDQIDGTDLSGFRLTPELIYFEYRADVTVILEADLIAK